MSTGRPGSSWLSPRASNSCPGKGGDQTGWWGDPAVGSITEELEKISFLFLALESSLYRTQPSQGRTGHLEKSHQWGEPCFLQGRWGVPGTSRASPLPHRDGAGILCGFPPLLRGLLTVAWEFQPRPPRGPGWWEGSCCLEAELCSQLAVHEPWGSEVK